MRLHHRLRFVTAIVTGLAVLALACYFVVTTGSTASAAPRYATTVTSRGADKPRCHSPRRRVRLDLSQEGLCRLLYFQISPPQGGASSDGPWINTANKTWDSLTKSAVQGTVSWPQASFSVTESGSRRIITGKRPAHRPHHRHLPDQLVRSRLCLRSEPQHDHPPVDFLVSSSEPGEGEDSPVHRRRPDRRPRRRAVPVQRTRR